MPLIQIWLQFALCALIITVAGLKLSRYGSIIAEKTGLSGTWIGLIMLASVTSLPELVTGVSAVTIADAPDIALGGVLGSLVFNLTILVVLDLLHRSAPIYTKAQQGHVLSAGFGVALIALTGFSLLLSPRVDGFAIGHVGFYTPLIVVAYFIAMRALFGFEKRQLAAFTEDQTQHFPDVTLRQAILGYSFAAAIVSGAGAWLPFVGEALAHAYGWHSSFVGTLFVAAATSLPELVVTLAALRLGALDMAIANLLGSNLFDILIIAVDDLFFLRGPLLSYVSGAHAFTTFSAIIMTGVAIIALILRPSGRVLNAVGWVSVLLAVVYVANSYVLFRFG